MKEQQILNYLQSIVESIPSDWLELTTHRLDIYNEELAKSEFIIEFEKLFLENNTDSAALAELPTAYDYIRLGHPLSSVLEWAIAGINRLSPGNVISFQSTTAPLLAILRKNKFDQKPTRIFHVGALPESFDADCVKEIYDYNFDLEAVRSIEDIPEFNGSSVFYSPQASIGKVELPSNVDFFVGSIQNLGSVLMINDDEHKDYISAIQHVRRRETVAMTPANCLVALKRLIGHQDSAPALKEHSDNKAKVLQEIQKITNAGTDALLGSSGLSVQYGIMMGLVDKAMQDHPNKGIRFLVPPNCYGGTNDQARRVAACLENVKILDLPVDRDHDMADSVNRVLDQAAVEDAVPYIIAEIPTNPRVEVPDLDQLRAALSKKRSTSEGSEAIAPVFILDQTFCPNVQFLGDEGILSSIATISYVSGSKFPSGGKCTAGYCVANKEAASLMSQIEKHMKLCNNEATALQVKILSEQMPSMNRRIQKAYENTREFVNFIQDKLPDAKINFVSEELAKQGFTPSVFSLDLPTKGETPTEREAYKRSLNHKLINMMITLIPNESKYCVSYGQLKGCYWTIPATSTQGTTKEEDKDYIARVSVSPDLDLEKHKRVFKDFVEQVK